MDALQPINRFVDRLLNQCRAIVPVQDCALPLHLKLRLLPVLVLERSYLEQAEFEPSEPEHIEPVQLELGSDCDTSRSEPTVLRPTTRIAINLLPSGEMGAISIGFDRKTDAQNWGDYLVLLYTFPGYSLQPSRFPEFKYELCAEKWDVSRLEKLKSYDFRVSPEANLAHSRPRAPKEPRKRKTFSQQLST